MGKELQCCRVCLKKSTKYIPLESPFRLDPPQLSYICIFNLSTRLGAVHDDALPQQLCSNCINDLVVTFNFLQLAQETDRKLRTFEGIERHEIRSSIFKLKYKRKTISPQNGCELHESDNVSSKNNIKAEFIACSRRDPLEETDEEEHKESSDEEFLDLRHVKTTTYKTNKGSVNKNASEDDDDDKPLNELFKKAKALKSEDKPNAVIDDYAVVCSRANDDDVDNDTDNDNLSNSATDDMHDFAPSPEAQIFPQGRYKCKQCVNAYFTAVGLKAHNAVHMPKVDKIKKKSRGPNKKSIKDKTVDESVEPSAKNSGTTVEEINLEQKNTIQKIRKQKQPKPKKMFPCHVCGKHMISASKLRYHMVMHTGEKDYLCTICPKAYSTIYALKHHMRTHTGERPYECKFCGDRFTRPTTLKSHMRRHTGERPYGCDICGKRFIQHSSMTTHMKLNHMAKTIPCPHCDKKYARQTDLTTHLLSHTGDKPFSCQLCSSRFIRQANLNKHMNQHHHAAAKTGNVSKKSATQSTRKLTKADTKNILPKESTLTSTTNAPSMPFKTQNNPVQTEVKTEFAARTNNSLAAEEAPYHESIALLPDNFSSTVNNNTLNKTSNCDIIGHLDSTKVSHYSTPSLSNNQPQRQYGETTPTTAVSTALLGSERLERAIDDINRWNWSSNAT